MTCWSRLGLGPNSRPPLRPIRRIAVGLVVIAGVLGLSRAFSEDEAGGSAAKSDRGLTERGMMFRISGTQSETDLDEVQAPPRPPVKEEAERSGAYTRVLSPRPDLIPMRRSPPQARPASPTIVQPPSALDAVPVLPRPAPDIGREGQTQTAKPRGAGLRIQQPQGIAEEARARRDPTSDQGTPAEMPSRTAASDQPDSGPASVVLPRPPAFADEPPAQEPPAEAPVVQTPPLQEPPAEAPVVQTPPLQEPPADAPVVQTRPVQEPPAEAEAPAAEQQVPPVAERIQELREDETPVEPGGEVAQITDDGPKARVVGVSAARESAAPPAQKSTGGPPAPQGATLKVWIGPAPEAPAAGKPAAGGSSSPTGPDASSTANGDSSKPAAKAVASATASAPGVKPLRLSLKFPLSPSAPVPKSLRVTNTRPPGAAERPRPARSR